VAGSRARTPWLREGVSGPQRQIIRDFAESRSKAPKDTEKRLPMRQRAGMPRHKRKREAPPTLERRTVRRRPAVGQAASAGYREARRQTAKPHEKAARRRDATRTWARPAVRDHDAITVENFRPEFLAGTTMACKAADAAIGLPLPERTRTRTVSGAVPPRKGNSARVM
jgi:hypothetical protein